VSSSGRSDGHAGRQRRRLTATEVDLGVVRQRALLVGGGDVSLDEAESSLAELALLTDTAGADPVEVAVQRRDTPDPATFIGTLALMAMTATLASLIPARRALRLDPIRALRQE